MLYFFSEKSDEMKDVSFFLGISTFSLEMIQIWIVS